MLSSGKSSRLYKRLVYDDQIATDVDASVDLREIGGLFVIEAGVRPGVDPAKVERALDEELARFLAGGPTPAELHRAKTRHARTSSAGVERIGGFGGKSDVLARGQVFAGRPDYYKVQLDRVAAATATQVRAAAARWLSDGVYTLEVQPFPDYAAAPRRVDRSKLPEPGAPARDRVPRSSSARRCRTASRSCSPSATPSRRCGSTCCSTPGTRPTSPRCPAPPASR